MSGISSQGEKEAKFGFPYFGLLEIIAIFKPKFTMAHKCVYCMLGN